MQTTRNSSAANAAPSRNIHIFFIVHSPLMAFMPFCLSIITILLDSLLVLSVKDIFCFSCTLQHKNRPGFLLRKPGRFVWVPKLQSVRNNSMKFRNYCFRLLQLLQPDTVIGPPATLNTSSHQVFCVAFVPIP